MRIIVSLAALLLASSAHAQQTSPAAAAPAAPAPAPVVAPISAEQQRTVERLRAAALESDLAWQLVEDLVTQVGPRLAGSEAEARARDWAEAMLREQRFANVRVEPFTLPFWDAVREEAWIVSPSRQPMVVAALGGSASTPVEGLEADVVRFESLAGLDAATNAQVRGRIVFIDERMTRTQDGSGYGVAVAKRGGCAVRAQSRGAVACIVRSVGTDTHRFAHQGGSSRQAAGVSLPVAAISPADADVLARLAARGAVRVRLNIQAERHENGPSGNVIAEVRGRERPEEIVLLAAHLDSWDLGHGALDDGAGVAIITAAARLIRDLPRRPRRTIRILLAGSEENGTFGGPAYATAHASEHHVVAAESDFGAGRVYSFSTRFNENAAPYARAIQRQLAPLGVNFSTERANGGADIADLGDAGVAIADLNQDGTDYFDYHHTANDTLDKIDPEALRQNVAAWAVFAYLAADSDWVFTPEAAPTAAAAQ
jgi:carboxypeptidase Q